MILNLNINDITQPVVKKVNRNSIVKNFIVKRLEIILKRKLSKFSTKLITELDNTILKVEGTHNHLKDLSPEKSSEMLIEIKQRIVDLEDIYTKLQEINFFDNKELKLKFKYLLKSIYKSEAITHKIAYRKKETFKTDESLKRGIIRMNSKLLKKSM